MSVPGSGPGLCLRDEDEIRSPVLVSPCDALDETGCPGLVNASLGAIDEAQIVSEFRHMAPGPGGDRVSTLSVLLLGDVPRCLLELSSPTGWTSGFLGYARQGGLASARGYL